MRRNVSGTEDALNFIQEAIVKAGYVPGQDVLLALDCAASEFYKDGKYELEGRGPIADPPRASPTISQTLRAQVPDRLDRGRAWPRTTGTAGSSLTERLGNQVQLVGDDLFVTNTKHLAQGIDQGVANSILIKVNQIGTLTETFGAVEMAKLAGYTAVISHRSGETEDSTIADIAVACGGRSRPARSSRSDRLAKYNQLLRIEEDLGDTAIYPGKRAFYNLR